MFHTSFQCVYTVCILSEAVSAPPTPPNISIFPSRKQPSKKKKMQYSTLVVLLYSWLRWKKMEIERDWGGLEGWGRCKVINNLWVKSNKRQKGVGWGALADRPCLLRRHIIIMPKKRRAGGWKWDGRCVPWCSNAFAAAVFRSDLLLVLPRSWIPFPNETAVIASHDASLGTAQTWRRVGLRERAFAVKWASPSAVSLWLWSSLRRQTCLSFFCLYLQAACVI